MMRRIQLSKLLLSFILLNLVFVFPVGAETGHSLKKQLVIERFLYQPYLNETHGPEGVIGYQMDSFITRNMFFTIGVYGIVKGVQGGYGVVNFGSGFREQILPRLFFDARLALGSGGGGMAPGGGGFMMELTSGIHYEVLENWFFDFSCGYLNFPTGTLQTPFIQTGLSFKYFRIHF